MSKFFAFIALIKEMLRNREIMSTLKKSEVKILAHQLCDLIEDGKIDEFFEKLGSLLQQKIPFGNLHPLGEILGKRGIKQPQIYFDVLETFFTKDLNFGYKTGIINSKKMKMSEEEIQKSRVYGWRAGIIAIAFNEMSSKYSEEIVEKTKQYILDSAHWSSSDTFADKVFNNIFVERFEWIISVLKTWAKDENIWLRNTAGFAIHAPFERKLLDISHLDKALSVLNLLMQDPDRNVKKKVGWTLRILCKPFPEVINDFLIKWAQIKDKNTYWIIKNGMKKLDTADQDSIKKMMKKE